MANIREIRKQFHSRSKKEQDVLIADLYRFSKEVQIFLENRLCNKARSQDFVEQMQNETSGVFDLPPREPSGRRINEIISQAKKSKVGQDVLIELERLAYQSFINMMNEYGFWDERVENMACRHLEHYLDLINTKEAQVRSGHYKQTQDFFESKKNMCNEVYLDVLFEMEQKTCAVD